MVGRMIQEGEEDGRGRWKRDKGGGEDDGRGGG